MDLVVWRIGTDTPDYEAHDLSGKGAEVTGGRWNRPGAPVVYTSISRALSCLETVVHLDGADPLPLNRYLVRITLPDSAWAARTVFDANTNVGWDAKPAGKVSLDWGTDWLQRADTLLAEVPSVIVPEEVNILINPRHVDARSVKATKVRKWLSDLRLK